jgi:hypothetical protein
MLFFKTHRGQVVLNFLFSFFAAVVIFAAMMKILHWQGSDIAIMVGLIAEAIVFMVMAFLVPPPKNHIGSVISLTLTHTRPGSEFQAHSAHAGWQFR